MGTKPRNNLEQNQENNSGCEEGKRRSTAVMNTPERMAESSDSSDSNDADLSITNFQNSGASLLATTTTTHEVNPVSGGNRTQNIQHQVVIQNPTAPIHLGPVYNLNIGQSQPMRYQQENIPSTFQNTNNSAS